MTEPASTAAPHSAPSPARERSTGDDRRLLLATIAGLLAMVIALTVFPHRRDPPRRFHGSAPATGQVSEQELITAVCGTNSPEDADGPEGSSRGFTCGGRSLSFYNSTGAQQIELALVRKHCETSGYACAGQGRIAFQIYNRQAASDLDDLGGQHIWA